MFKKILLTIAGMIVTMGFAFADVDVNKADQAALDGIKGIGPAKSKLILAERTKNGNFKDWSDFQTRVKGIGDKNSVALSAAGLTVNGQAKPGVATKSATADKVVTKAVKVDASAAVASASAKALPKDVKTK
ncbi:ComEA family DNA-binding protein [Undibacterium sp. RuRC25W]|uniref:ComEA family DNA-binding protein n=1 Tax=Undibacterium sp. RuRC25W TaxID=3413047 RepID=UPI003BF39E8A